MKLRAVMLACFLIIAAVAGSSLAPREKEPRCYPTDDPTGRVMCFSDGVLVYMTQTYRNGGVLCTDDGVELKLPKDLCIEESRQGDAWSPPPKD